MKTVTIYTCRTATEARDRANLYYIASATARRMTTEDRTISIRNAKGAQIAVFTY